MTNVFEQARESNGNETLEFNNVFLESNSLLGDESLAREIFTNEKTNSKDMTNQLVEMNYLNELTIIDGDDDSKETNEITELDTRVADTNSESSLEIEIAGPKTAEMEQFKQEMARQAETIPEYLRDLVAERLPNSKFVLAETMQNYSQELAAKHPSGHKQNVRFENLTGAFNNVENEIVVIRLADGRYESSATTRRGKTLRHEFGHALNRALARGDEQDTAATARYSGSKEFRSAIDKDYEAIQEAKDNGTLGVADFAVIEYLLEANDNDGTRARDEAFSEVARVLIEDSTTDKAAISFKDSLSNQSESFRTNTIKNSFPNTFKLLQTKFDEIEKKSKSSSKV